MRVVVKVREVAISWMIITVFFSLCPTTQSCELLGSIKDEGKGAMNCWLAKAFEGRQ